MSSSDYDYFERSLVADASLHPPIHGEGPDDGAPMPGSILLDFKAYIDQRRNATSAHSKTRDGHSIHVTFWPAHPPRVSYFSVCCPDLEPGDFAEEPVIVAAEDDLVLLRLFLGPRSATAERDRVDYFIYQAGGGMPSLELLKHPGPSRIFDDRHVGLLRCRSPTSDDSHSKPILRPHGSKDDGFYIVAALCYGPMVPGYYDLHTYDSRTKDWATKTALMRQEQVRGHHSSHCNSKVIVVGGRAGTMGWVDLWRGILFCDVLLQDQPLGLRFVALPAPIKPDRKLKGCPRIARDIAVIKGCIKYVELQTHVRPGSAVDGNFIADDWTTATWSRKATTKSLEKGSWQPGCKVRASQISAKKNPVQFESLPKLLDDQGMPQPTLERLHTAHPTHSLHEDNVVYLMTKIHYLKDTKAWVLAIDARKKTLQGVAEFDARITFGMSFTCMCSSISEHLHLAPATNKGSLETIRYADAAILSQEAGWNRSDGFASQGW